MGVGERFQRFVNVLAIIDADRPLLKNFHGVFRRCAHRRIRVRFFDDGGFIRLEVGLVGKIIESDDGALEGNFARVLSADLIERLVCFRDCVFHRGIDRFRRLLPIGNSQDGIRFGRRSTEIIDSFKFSTAKIDNDNGEQDRQVKMFHAERFG